MNKAKFYTYRNLNAGGFSIKHRGKVVERSGGDAWVLVANPEFRVSAATSAKIKQTRTRQVHAYVVSNEFMRGNAKIPQKFLDNTPTLKYNPHRDTEFSLTDGSDLTTVKCVVFYNNNAYAVNKTSDLATFFE